VRKTFFFKKRSKKLSPRYGGSLKQGKAESQKFFGSFFQKRTPFLPWQRPHPFALLAACKFPIA
jgi:hypothetical protein